MIRKIIKDYKRFKKASKIIGIDRKLLETNKSFRKRLTKEYRVVSMVNIAMKNFLQHGICLKTKGIKL